MLRTAFRPASLAACLLIALTVLAGCGSSGSSGNGVASKSADAIVAAAGAALSGVNSVHVAGSAVSEGKSLELDLDLVSGKGGRGSIAQAGLSFQIVAIGKTVYIDGSDPFWRHFGGTAAVQLFHGRWLKAPATGQFSSLAALTDLHQLFSKLLSNHGTLAKGSTITVNGQKAIALKDTSRGGTLYVATTGKPYPVEIINGAEKGRVTFDHFNEAVSLVAPANSIDISQLPGAG